MGRGKPSNPFVTMSIQCLLIFRNLYRVRSHTRCISFKSNIDERQQERRHTLVVKNLSAKCRRYKRLSFDPWIGKFPWRRNGNPLQYSCLENLMILQRGPVGCSSWGQKGSDKSEAN